MFDQNAAPMAAAFMPAPDLSGYRAVLPGSLCRKPVHPDLIPECRETGRPRTLAVEPRRGAAWWIARTQGMDFSHHDAVDPVEFNALLETGL